jgi:metal-sulfur cluster biosynthetic enzyme
MISEEAVWKQLKKVLDPELGINVVDLGLIYTVEVKNDDVFILMTLTFPGCPLAGVINKEIKEKVGKLRGIGNVNLKITFDPPWDLSKMSEEAKAKLGFRFCLEKTSER